MGNQKYCYAIVNNENGNILIDVGRLHFYFKRHIACATLKYLVVNKDYVVVKIELNELEKLILKSKKINYG